MLINASALESIRANDVNVTSFDRCYLHWSFIVLEVAAMVVIVVGDISMLMMFFTRKLLGQSTNILVFSVAIGDLVTGVMAFPLAMVQKILIQPSDFLCKGYFYFANVSKTAVGYTILLLAMERIVAVLSHTFRILPPGRCLFFASLTWFFAAAYNIWSVIIYDLEVVSLTTSEDSHRTAFTLCFASTRFMYLHDIFQILNPLVTFTLPVIFSATLFIGFWLKKHEADKPGRPYKSSKSVVIFTFALLISFFVSHLPWEIANLVLKHDAHYHTDKDLVVIKTLHIISFSRGFWDIFIFGSFRHYVCKKEKALAHFREQRSTQMTRTSLVIPLTDRALSTSLLDSDPSVSRRYSSDIPTTRRPSALDEALNHSEIVQGAKGCDAHALTASLNAHLSATATTHVEAVVTTTYLVPRSPCSSDGPRTIPLPVIKTDKSFLLPEWKHFHQSTLTIPGMCEVILEDSEDVNTPDKLNSPLLDEEKQLHENTTSATSSVESDLKRATSFDSYLSNRVDGGSGGLSPRAVSSRDPLDSIQELEGKAETLEPSIPAASSQYCLAVPSFWTPHS